MALGAALYARLLPCWLAQRSMVSAFQFAEWRAFHEDAAGDVAYSQAAQLRAQ